MTSRRKNTKPIRQWTDAEMEADPIGALCQAVSESGCTMTLYGQSVGEAGLRSAATASGVSRAGGEPLGPDEVKAIARDADERSAVQWDGDMAAVLPHDAVEEAVAILTDRCIIALADLPSAVRVLGLEPRGRLGPMLDEAQEYAERLRRERERKWPARPKPRGRPLGS